MPPHFLFILSVYESVALSVYTVTLLTAVIIPSCSLCKPPPVLKCERMSELHKSYNGSFEVLRQCPIIAFVLPASFISLSSSSALLRHFFVGFDTVPCNTRSRLAFSICASARFSQHRRPERYFGAIAGSRRSHTRMRAACFSSPLRSSVDLYLTVPPSR